MSLRIAWHLNNGGRAYHDIYIRSTSMTWPSDMPAKSGTTEPGVNQFLADVSASEPWYVMVVAWEGDKFSPSGQWFYDPVSEEFRDGGYYLDDNGDLRNDYEYLTSTVVFDLLVIDRVTEDITDFLASELVFDVQVKDLWDNDKSVKDFLSSELIFNLSSIWRFDHEPVDTVDSDIIFNVSSIWRTDYDVSDILSSDIIFSIDIKDV